ncbi:MAG: hypothetical protein GFH27_549379n15 [Chloroflexi bacterium AL-W]|nr:hypothetical protein [Chloroflexi bacterium AL-N1]NOK71139.1 hypothetical protein [Chloroflexi bacterium AL-N10]NOK78605.1 hypothetical protein [Chloroflexi bacterium AL-N5]NOK85901.1 hypothetical protein [Chloroflexi bacterium AL-W]NOK92876.1 hypothetical protein [Chloroflexi bacterium AL-N15]
MKLHIVFACCVVLVFGGFYASNSLTTIEASNLAVVPAQVDDPSGIASDDFNEEALDTDIWEIIQPTVGGISGTLTLDGTNALIELPEGTEFESWVGGHNATRIMQDANDEDFQVEVKFDTFPEPSTSQGIMVELNDDTSEIDRFLRFEFYRAPNGDLFGFIAELQPNDGVGQPYTQVGGLVQTPITGVDTAPLYLRLTRTGPVFSLDYSTDGEDYEGNGLGSRSRALPLTRVGAYVSNPEPSGGTAPAYTGSIDYFQNTADEDFVDDPVVEPTPTPTEEPVDPTATPTLEPGEPTPTPTLEPGEPTPTLEPGEPTPTPGPVDPIEGVFLPLIIR